MFKYIVDDLETVQEPHRGFYEKTEDGKFRLNVEGAVPREKLDEFRSNNIELLKKLEPFKDIDPKKYGTLIELEKKVNDKTLVDAGKLEEVINSRVSSMKQEFETKEQTLTQQLESSNKQLESLVIDSAVRVTALESGVLPTAVDDVMLRARSTFKIIDGKAVPHADGKPVYGKDGVNTMSVGEWVTALSKNAPHLFGSTQGGGSRGSTRTGGGTAPKSSIQKIAAGLGSR